MKTSFQKILELICAEKQITAKTVRERLGVSQVLVHRHLKKLCQENKIQKIGSPPRVFYIPISEQETNILSSNDSSIIEENWLEILPNGQFIFGRRGFSIWCAERGFEVITKQAEFEAVYREKEQWKNHGLIDATEKITGSFDENYLEKIWYLDFYSWEIFGKTLLGKLILYAKQNSDEVLMKTIADRIKAPILNLLHRESFDLIGVIPHAVPRRKDFLRTTLQLLPLSPSPQKIFSKIFADHVVAQKTLKSKKEREQNAQSTLFLNINTFPPKVLLIDDACGSGATLNIAAQKIRERSPQTRVFGLAFVGSLKGFEVISET